MVIKQLEESNLEKAPSVIKMLGIETEVIAKKMESAEAKFDTFISHVQKCSADLCGRLSDALSHAGLTSWYDMNASKLDTRGIIEGVIDSKVFTVFLTKDYFQRQWCLFEYGIALAARKPIVALYEADPRFEGGHLNEFDIPKQFKQVMSHEVIKIDRRHWKTFFASFKHALKTRQNSVSIFTDAIERVKSRSNILNKNSDIRFLRSTLQSCGWKFGERIYSSTVDGFTAKSFHDKCDEVGATLTVIKLKNDVVFGTFVPLSWESPKAGKTVESQEAWLFDLKDKRAPKCLGMECGKVEVNFWDSSG